MGCSKTCRHYGGAGEEGAADQGGAPWVKRVHFNKFMLSMHQKMHAPRGCLAP